MLTHQAELEKENNEGKRLEIQKLFGDNDRKRLEKQLEIEKRSTLRQQQQHDWVEGERKRLHEIQIETKKSETIIAETKIKEENDVKKLQEKYKHEAAMQDKCNEEKRIVLKIKQQEIKDKHLELESQAKQHKHELEMQERRYLSFSMVVLNSRDQQGKLWLPHFSHF